MTTHPSPGAREIAEKHVGHYECEDSWYSCPLSKDGLDTTAYGCFKDTGLDRTACTCSYERRVTALAQAIEEYGTRLVHEHIKASQREWMTPPSGQVIHIDLTAEEVEKVIAACKANPGNFFVSSIQTKPPPTLRHHQEDANEVP